MESAIVIASVNAGGNAIIVRGVAHPATHQTERKQQAKCDYGASHQILRGDRELITSHYIGVKIVIIDKISPFCQNLQKDVPMTPISVHRKRKNNSPLPYVPSEV
jgi:hypothetical protein